MFVCVLAILCLCERSESQTTDHQAKQPTEASALPTTTPRGTARTNHASIDSEYAKNGDDDFETGLQKERIRAVSRERSYRKARFSEGQEQMSLVIDVQRRLTEALLDFHQEPEKIVEVLQQQLTFARQIEENRHLRAQAGMGRPADLAHAIWFRAESELELLQARQKHGLHAEPSDQTDARNRSVNSKDDSELYKKIFFVDQCPPAYRFDSADDRETSLKKERIWAAHMDLAANRKSFENGSTSIFFLAPAQHRLTEALLDFHTEPQKIIEILQQQVTATRQIEENRRLRIPHGIGRPDDYQRARYARAVAEWKLAEARRKFGLENEREAKATVERVASAPEKDRQELGQEYASLETKHIPDDYRAVGGDDHFVALQKEIIRAAHMEAWFVLNRETSATAASEVYHRLTVAQLDFHNDAHKAIEILEKQLAQARRIEDELQGRYKEGIVSSDATAHATYFRATAELQLHRAMHSHANSSPPHNKPPAHAADFDWDKKFDASLETEPERRKWARQYNAIVLLAEPMREFFRRERIDTLSYRKVRVKQLELRYRLETELHEKKKILEILVYEIKVLQEVAALILEDPSATQLGTRDIDDLVDVTLKTIEWESELEQVTAKLAAAKQPSK